jgi:hypothetical protein
MRVWRAMVVTLGVACVSWNSDAWGSPGGDGAEGDAVVGWSTVQSAGAPGWSTVQSAGAPGARRSHAAVSATASGPEQLSAGVSATAFGPEHLSAAVSATASGLEQLSAAQTASVLGRGDLAITGYGSDGDDALSFALLRGVEAGTGFRMTDRGWLVEGGFRPGESSLALQFTRAAECGEEFVVSMSGPAFLDAGGAVAGTIEGPGLALSTAGDQVFFYGGEAAESGDGGDLIAALQMNGGWDEDASSTNTSALPVALAGGPWAQALSPEVDNARYDCSVLEAAPADLLAGIHSPASWLRDDGQPFALGETCGFVCSSSCESPDVPSVAGELAVVAGDRATLGITSGELGGAEDWAWYAGSCGGALLGRGPELSFSPAQSLSVFVRGEGGCTVPGPCAEIGIEVANAPPSEQERKCASALLRRLPGVAGAHAGLGLSCVRSVLRGRAESAAACLEADAENRLAGVHERVGKLEARSCPVVPTLGPRGASEIIEASALSGGGLLAAVLGADLDGALSSGPGDRKRRACQMAVVGVARRCLLARLRAFARCASRGVAGGELFSPGALAVCLAADAGTPVEGACGLASGARGALGKRLQKRCVDQGVSPSSALPGCPGAGDVDSAWLCLSSAIERLACHAARAVGASSVSCEGASPGGAIG